MCNPAVTFCALVEQEDPKSWRWAVYGIEDIACVEGAAPTHAAARCAAVKALVTLDRQGVIKLPANAPDDVPPIGTGAFA